jgi:hypothetical protein
MNAYSLEKTDAILDELENVARRGDPEHQFYSKLLEATQTLLDPNTVLVATAESPPWILMQRGTEVLAQSLATELSKLDATIAPDSAETGSSSGSSSSGSSSSGSSSSGSSSSREGQWFVTRFPSSRPTLLLAIQSRHPATASPSTRTRNLLHALGEIAEVRELAVSSSRTDGIVRTTLRRATEVSEATEMAMVDRGFVEAMREAVQADRVSLYERAGMIACSGTTRVDPRSPTVNYLEKRIESVAGTSQPQWLQVDSESPHVNGQGLSLYLPCEVPPPNGANPSVGASPFGILVEWENKVGIVDRAQGVAIALPILQQAWQQQRRWLQVPPGVQAKAMRRASGPTAGGLKSRFLITGILLASILGISLLPYPFAIQADGVLEPAKQRYIHAPLDSLIETIFVGDGETVAVDQPLIQLRSPTLDLQIEEVLGQIRALEEKRDGLRIAVNQLTNNSSDVPNQIRISSELKLIDAQRFQANEKLQFLDKERSELLLRSPLQGVVIANDLERELRNRPLQRGDTLFRIAATEGPWQMQLAIPDRDSGIVEQALRNGPISIQWGLDSGTSIEQTATLNSMRSDVVWYPNRGSHRNAVATIPEGSISQPALNAVAFAKIPCGTRPVWYVWSRPLIEFLQKRFWLPSFTYQNTTTSTSPPTASSSPAKESIP